MVRRRGPVYLLLSRHQSFGTQKRTPCGEDQSMRFPWISSPLPSPFPFRSLARLGHCGCGRRAACSLLGCPSSLGPWLAPGSPLSPLLPLLYSGHPDQKQHFLISLPPTLSKKSILGQSLPKIPWFAKFQTRERILRIRRLFHPSVLTFFSLLLTSRRPVGAIILVVQKRKLKPGAIQLHFLPLAGF